MYLYYPQYTSFIILDLVYTSKGFYVSNQVRSQLMYLSGLEATGLYT